MKKIVQFLALMFGFIASSCAQVPEDRPTIKNPDFDKRLTQLLSFSVPVVGVEEAALMQETGALFLDAREDKEFEISHIEGATHCGYDHFDMKSLDGVDKDTPLVIYCSVGFRSEKIANKLKKAGYSKVFNLYGSIFEWVNQDKPVVDKTGTETDKVHTYNAKWSQWVEDGKAEKIY